MSQLMTIRPSTVQITPADYRAAHEGAYAAVEQQQAEHQEDEAEQRCVHADGPGQAVEEVVHGAPDAAQQAGEQVHHEADRPAQHLAQSVEKPSVPMSVLS